VPSETAPTRYAGRVYIITGGGSGIGRAAALRLAPEGAQVVIADRRAELADAVLAEIRQLGSDGLAASCDVAIEDGVCRWSGPCRSIEKRQE